MLDLFRNRRIFNIDQTRLVYVPVYIYPDRFFQTCEIYKPIRPFDDCNGLFVLKNLIKPHCLGWSYLTVEAPQIDVIYITTPCFIKIYKRKAGACDFIDIKFERIQYALR